MPSVIPFRRAVSGGERLHHRSRTCEGLAFPDDPRETIRAWDDLWTCFKYSSRETPAAEGQPNQRVPSQSRSRCVSTALARRLEASRRAGPPCGRPRSRGSPSMTIQADMFADCELAASVPSKDAVAASPGCRKPAGVGGAPRSAGRPAAWLGNRMPICRTSARTSGSAARAP